MARIAGHPVLFTVNNIMCRGLFKNNLSITAWLEHSWPQEQFLQWWLVVTGELHCTALACTTLSAVHCTVLKYSKLQFRTVK